MRDFQVEAVRNVALKAQYPNIDDPVRAINFVLDVAAPWAERIEFLRAWREGCWAEIERDWPEYLQGIA